MRKQVTRTAKRAGASYRQPYLFPLPERATSNLHMLRISSLKPRLLLAVLHMDMALPKTMETPRPTDRDEQIMSCEVGFGNMVGYTNFTLHEICMHIRPTYFLTVQFGWEFNFET